MVFLKKCKMAKSTSITLGNILRKLLKTLFRQFDMLREINKEEQKIRVLKEAIEAGEKSGYVKIFDPVKFLERMYAKHSI